MTSAGASARDATLDAVHDALHTYHVLSVRDVLCPVVSTAGRSRWDEHNPSFSLTSSCPQGNILAAQKALRRLEDLQQRITEVVGSEV